MMDRVENHFFFKFQSTNLPLFHFHLTSQKHILRHIIKKNHMNVGNYPKIALEYVEKLSRISEPTYLTLITEHRLVK